MTAQTDAATEADGYMSMEAEAQAYADGAWECEVEYTFEGGEPNGERFFDLRVPGDSVPSGLLQNLQARGYMITAVVAGDDSVTVTATPDR